MKSPLLAGVVLLVSLAAGQAQSTPVRPAIWIDVPFVAQTTDGCGSASIAMVMQYWEQKTGRPAAAATDDPEKIQKKLFSHSADGIYASRMQQYLVASGYQAIPFHGQWSDLEHHLSLGRPLIVAIKAAGAHGPLHYLVVVGVDPDRGYVFLNDPAQQKMLRISKKGFESEWGYTDDWTLLAVPRTGA